MSTELTIRTADLPALPPEDIAELYRQWAKIRAIGRRLEKRIREIIDTEGKCDTFEIEEREGNRKISDIPAAFAALADSPLTQADFLECCTVKVSALESAYVAAVVGDDPPRGAKTHARDEFAEIMGDVIQLGNPVRSVVETRVIYTGDVEI